MLKTFNTLRKCTNCEHLKFQKEFNECSTECKTCTYRKTQLKKASKIGLIAKIYYQQRANSKGRGHAAPAYSKKELENWLMSQDKFHKLHQKWRETGYKKALIPSVDRISDHHGYTFDNIQLMTWGENFAKGQADMKNGKSWIGMHKEKVTKSYITKT
jgi:hypothetical protein